MLAVMERSLLDSLNVVYHDGTPEDDRAYMAVEYSNGFTPSTWLVDSGAMTHMMNSDEGMFEAKEIIEQIRISNGKNIEALKLGKVRLTAIQVDDVTKEVVLNDCNLYRDWTRTYSV